MAARSFWDLALLASLLGTLGAQGCVNDGVSLHVICPIVPTVDDNLCTFEPDAEACVGEGVMNLATTQHYTLFLRAESGLKARSVDVPPRGETNGIQIRSAEIELRDPSGAHFNFESAPLPNPFTVTATGYLPPEGFGAVELTVLDETWGKRLGGAAPPYTPLQPQLVAVIKLKGVTSGAVEIESGEYYWPIRFTNSACIDVDEYCLPGQDLYAFACGS